MFLLLGEFTVLGCEEMEMEREIVWRGGVEDIGSVDWAMCEAGFWVLWGCVAGARFFYISFFLGGLGSLGVDLEGGGEGVGKERKGKERKGKGGGYIGIEYVSFETFHLNTYCFGYSRLSICRVYPDSFRTEGCFA